MPETVVHVQTTRWGQIGASYVIIMDLIDIKPNTINQSLCILAIAIDIVYQKAIFMLCPVDKKSKWATKSEICYEKHREVGFLHRWGVFQLLIAFHLPEEKIEPMPKRYLSLGEKKVCQ